MVDAVQAAVSAESFGYPAENQSGLAEATAIGGGMAVVYAVCQFACSPLMGNLGDRFGRRPVVLRHRRLTTLCGREPSSWASA